jgi:hypothetical protein
MTISQDDLSTIDDLLGGAVPAAEAGAELRRRLPHLSLTRCDASDMTEDPYKAFPDFDLHLISAVDHCVSYVTEPARATGIVLARKAATP